MVGSPRSPTATSGMGPLAPTSPSWPGQAASSQSPGPVSPPQSAAVQSELGHNDPIVADEHPNDTLDLDNDSASSSASIMSSVYQYRYENGRRYHAYKDGSYAGPNDDIEKERLNLQHYMCRELTFDGKLFICPADPEKMHRVLDCGTGTGIWAIDLADDHPNIEATGVDLSAIQPDFIPPNVRFYVDDLEDTWVYSQPFDLIYARMLTGSLGDFPKFFQQSYDNLTPGGWVECLDVVMPFECDDNTMGERSAIREWSNLYLEASKRLGKPVNSARGYAKQMTAAGFVNVTERKFRWPTNPWPKEKKFKDLGLWMYENIGRNLSGVSLALFTRGLGWTPAQLEVFLVNVRKEIKDPGIHAYSPIWVVYGQKPSAYDAPM